MITLEPISPASVAHFKTVRLRALQDSPTAFASRYEDELGLTEDDWRARAARCGDGTSIGYLAMDAGVPCGIVRGTRDNHDEEGARQPVIWVESMWVAPSHRRQGVGRILIDAIIDWARARHASVVKLEVTSHNARAISFYRGCGFTPTGKTQPYPNDPTLTECEMSLPLQ